MSPVHCAVAQLPEICDISGRLENPALVVLEAKVVLMVGLEDVVLLVTKVVGMLGKVDKTKVGLVEVDEVLGEDVVVVLPCGEDEGMEKPGAVEIVVAS